MRDWDEQGRPTEVAMLTNMGDTLKTWWEGATAANRALAIGMAVLIVVALIVAGSLASSPDFTPIYHGVSGKDASSIEATLREQNITMHFDDKDGTVAVPSKDESKAVMAVEAAGILSKDTSIAGFEQLPAIGMGTSTEVERARILNADEGEMDRKLMKLDPISNAAVTISLGNSSSLFGTDVAPTAAVILTLKSGQSLSDMQVKGIVNLVAHAVPGLTTANVALTDQTGAPLWKDNGAGDNGIGGVNQTWNDNLKYAETVRARLQSLLDSTLGPHKAILTVNADVDNDQTQIDQVQHSLPLGLRSPIALSTREKDTKYTGSGAPSVGGAAGSASNLGGPPTYSTSGGAGGGGTYTETDTTQNNIDPDITHTVKQQAPGSVKKLTVAAFVDSSIAATDIPRIQNFLGTAIGAMPGDTTRLVTVQQMAFDTSALKASEAQTKSLASQEMMSNVAKALAVCVAAGVLLFILLKSGGAARKAGAMQAPELALEGDGANIGLLEAASDQDLEALLEERPLSIEDVLAEMPEAQPRPRRRRAPSIESHQDMKLESIQNMVTTHPESVALLMKGWMAEDIRQEAV